MPPEAMVKPTKEVVNFNIQRNLIKEPFFSTWPFTSRAFAYLHCSFLPFHLSIIQSCYADEFMGSIVLFCISCLRSILQPFVNYFQALFRGGWRNDCIIHFRIMCAKRNKHLPWFQIKSSYANCIKLLFLKCVVVPLFRDLWVACDNELVIFL